MMLDAGAAALTVARTVSERQVAGKAQVSVALLADKSSKAPSQTCTECLTVQEVDSWTCPVGDECFGVALVGPEMSRW